MRSVAVLTILSDHARTELALIRASAEPTSDYADMRLRNPVPVAGPGATSAGTANAPSRVPPPVIRQVVPLRENVSSLPRVSAAQTGAAPVVVKTEPMQVDTA